MDMNFSKEHLMARQLFHDFAVNEVEPWAEQTDEEHRFPKEIVGKMQELGFMGVPFPKEIGGQGCDTLAYVLLVEELAKVCATTAVIVSAHTSLAADAIAQFGNETQKEQFLRPLAEGKKLGSFALTEAEAGTDASGLNTKAVRDGDSWVINGTKVFITNAGQADIYVIFAMTDKTAGTRGISAFIIEKGTPGFSFGLPEKKMGIRGSSTCELIFEDCRIPLENLLGREGKGFGIAMATLDGGRIGIAAQALGIAEGAFEKTITYVKERKQFKTPIAKFQNTQFVLAQMKTEIEAARFLVYDAALKKDSGKPYSVEAAMAKLKCSQVASDVTRECVQLHGGYGYIQAFQVERMMRDAKITEIYEGTSEVMKMVISGSLLR
ncbi:MAG TPA: acyl-CoA dehydrogenase [Anaerolineaceae bacterium]|nr:acyl-CoA dehydrogenase [Anaerolineaceae bacterium]